MTLTIYLCLLHLVLGLAVGLHVAAYQVVMHLIETAAAKTAKTK